MKKYRPFVIALILFGASQAMAQNTIPLSNLNEAFQTAILSTGCSAPVTDKPKLIASLDVLEKKLKECIENADDGPEALYTKGDFNLLLQPVLQAKASLSKTYDAHAIHEIVHDARLRLAGMRVSRGYVCFNDYLWILHEAFHPAMHLGRHLRPAQQLTGEDWNEASDSIARASMVQGFLKTLCERAPIETNPKTVKFVGYLERALNDVDEALRQKSNARLKSAANNLRKVFQELVKTKE